MSIGYDKTKLDAIVAECNQHNEDIGAGVREPDRVMSDAQFIYMHRHDGIRVETLCMMLTDACFGDGDRILSGRSGRN